MSDLSATQIYYETREICHRDVYKHIAALRKSLLDLKSESKRVLFENTLFWQKEVERGKQEKDQEWLEKVNFAESENKRLRTIIENLMKHDGSKVARDHQLWEAESQISKLSRQLDMKLIHINRLQNTLAERSKAILELQKSWVCSQYKRTQNKENNRLRKLEPKYEIDNGKLQPFN